jgi:predicted ATP-grasp superfamily ATP-dependent carboligase
MRTGTTRGIRVLVTGGDHTPSLAALRALRAAGYEPWAGVVSPRAYAARSRAAAGTIVLPSSGSEPAAFANRLGAELRRLGFSVVIPGTEQDLLAIAEAHDPALRSAAGVPEYRVVLQVIDKAAVYRAARGVGLEVPRTEALDRGRLPDDGDFPLIVKPLRSASAAHGGALVRTDAELVASREELTRLWDRTGGGDWLAQERVRGQLGAISGVAHHGRIVAAVHQRSLRVWPPRAGVSAFAHTVAPDSALESAVARLIEALSWSGIFQTQFIHNDRGAHLIDLNPRVYGSLALAVAAGVNLPAIWAGLLTGSAGEPPAYRVGVRYRSEELDVRALLHLARRGHPLAAAAGVLPHRHTAHAVLTLADPAPGLTSLGKLVRRRRPSVSSR